MRHPPYDARVVRQRDDRVPRNAEISLAGLSVVAKEGVDEPEELHDALVLPQVLVALEEKRVLAPIAADHRQLARPLL